MHKKRFKLPLRASRPPNIQGNQRQWLQQQLRIEILHVAFSSRVDSGTSEDKQAEKRSGENKNIYSQAHLIYAFESACVYTCIY